MSNWLSKIGEYAPDIFAAITTGGASLPATALRIASKELLGYETDNPDLVEKAVNEATPEQMLKLKQANNNFIVKKMELKLADINSARDMYKVQSQQADKIADRITKYNVIYVFLMVIINCLVVKYMGSDAALVAIASNVIGMVIKSLLDQVQSVTGFYFGSSLGSKQKTEKK